MQAVPGSSLAVDEGSTDGYWKKEQPHCLGEAKGMIILNSSLKRKVCDEIKIKAVGFKGTRHRIDDIMIMNAIVPPRGNFLGSRRGLGCRQHHKPSPYPRAVVLAHRVPSSTD